MDFPAPAIPIVIITIGFFFSGGAEEGPAAELSVSIAGKEARSRSVAEAEESS